LWGLRGCGNVADPVNRKFFLEGHRMARKLSLMLILAAAALLTATTVFAASAKVGDPAPDFKGILGVDDKQHGLSDFADAKLVVLVFTCNHCPVAQAYEDRLIALQKDYQSKGVQVVAINVNNIPPDQFDKMKERAEAKGFNFPYLDDPTQKMGHDYGATNTPHVFLLDQKRKIVYMGAIDDAMKPEKVKKHYLRDAIDALLDGKEPPVAVTKQFGCGIKYE
jgi:peroxiredoxin